VTIFLLLYIQPQQTCHHWKINKAEWIAFENQCKSHLGYSSFTKPLSVAEFTSDLINIATSTISKTSGNVRNPKKPWLTDEYKADIKACKKTVRNLRCHPSTQNIETKQIARAKARRTTRQAKNLSWHTFFLIMRKTYLI